MNAIVIGLLAQEGNVAGWPDLFLGLDQGHRFILLLVVIGCLTAIVISAVSMISSAAGRIHQRRTQAELKREMLERGLGADEIAKVLEASVPEGGLDRVTASWHKSK